MTTFQCFFGLRDIVEHSLMAVNNLLCLSLQKSTFLKLLLYKLESIELYIKLIGFFLFALDSEKAQN